MRCGQGESDSHRLGGNQVPNHSAMPAISGPGGSRALMHVLARHGTDLSDKPEQHAPTESNRVHGTWKPAGRHGLTRKSSWADVVTIHVLRVFSATL